MKLDDFLDAFNWLQRLSNLAWLGLSCLPHRDLRGAWQITPGLVEIRTERYDDTVTCFTGTEGKRRTAVNEGRESELRRWVEEARHSVDRAKLWLRTTRKSIEWHKEQLKQLREEEKRCAGYVAEAQAHLAECEGWLAQLVARQAESEVV